MQTTIQRLRATGPLQRHQHAGAFALFAAVICGIYAPVLDGARSLITNGTWSQPLFVLDPLAGGPATAPLTRLAAASWLHLRLPVMDPFQGFGVPLLPNQGVPVYPPQLLFHLLFPSNYSIWNVVNLVALAFGVYLLARSFGQGFLGAVGAGFLGALAGAAPPNVNMSMLNPLAVLPFLLVAIRYAVDPGYRFRPAGWLGIATTVALLCLSGFQEVLPLMAVVAVVYLAALTVHFGTWRRRPGLVLGTAASAVAGGVVGSIGLFPVFTVLSGGTTLNAPGAYLPHVPLYWLSTLTLPTLTGRALNQAPQDVNNVVFTLGTPFLVLVVVLALAIALRSTGRGTRWYVFPSAALVVYGVLGYADVGRVLQAFDVPLFDAIQSRRFLQFAWWIPLCLLLGAVVSHVRQVRWRDALLALVLAGAFDAYFFERYRQALAAAHVPDATPSILHAPVVAGGAVVVFVLAALAARRFGPAPAGLAMTVVVLATCIYDLPTNFPPASYDAAVSAVRVPGHPPPPRDVLAFFGSRQLPTQQYSFQIYGPIIPTGYRNALTALFSVPEAGGLDPIAGALPTLAQLTLTPRAVSVLRSLGVNLLVVPDALSPSVFPPVPDCGTPLPGPVSHEVCLLGTITNPDPGVAYAPPRDFAYHILGADPLVQRGAKVIAVSSTRAATADFTRGLSGAVAAIPDDAYVTSGRDLPRAARGVRGVWRRSTTQTVTLELHSRSSGMAVLRESYVAGVRATVNGHSVATFPVDGGLWTAVHVGSGSSVVVLDYATTADLVALWVGVAGLAALAAAWFALGARALRRRRTPSPAGRAPHRGPPAHAAHAAPAAPPTNARDPASTPTRP